MMDRRFRKRGRHFDGAVKAGRGFDGRRRPGKGRNRIEHAGIGTGHRSRLRRLLLQRGAFQHDRCERVIGGVQHRGCFRHDRIEYRCGVCFRPGGGHLRNRRRRRGPTGDRILEHQRIWRCRQGLLRRHRHGVCHRRQRRRLGRNSFRCAIQRWFHKRRRSRQVGMGKGIGSRRQQWPCRRLILHSTGDRQRPIAQRFKAAAGDIENFLAAGTPVTQGLQVVLQTGHRIGQSVELAAAGNALAADQFDVDVLLYALQIVGRRLQVQHAQGTGHLAQQPRHFQQALVVPVGFDEGDEGLARQREICDRLMRQHFHGATCLHRRRIVIAAHVRAQVRDLVIQRGVDIEQRAGDIQQQVVVDGTVSTDHLAQRVTLLHDHTTRHAQAHHPQRIGHRTQLGHLGLQFGRRAVHTHMQIQRILDPQQLFLHRAADRVEQLAVAATQAAARMLQLRRRRLASVRIEGEQHALVDALVTARTADFIEQRQQHDRDVAMAVLQAFQIIGQQHRAAHQGRAGLVTVRHRAIADRVGQ